MSAKLKNIKSNLKKVDDHHIQPHEYDELPELTDEMMENAVYKVGGIEKTPPRRRGKQKSPIKVALQIRLPQEVVSYFKAEGAGWQTRISEVLQKWIMLHPHSRYHSHK